MKLINFTLIFTICINSFIIRRQVGEVTSTNRLKAIKSVVNNQAKATGPKSDPNPLQLPDYLAVVEQAEAIAKSSEGIDGIQSDFDSSDFQTIADDSVQRAFDGVELWGRPDNFHFNLMANDDEPITSGTVFIDN